MLSSSGRKDVVASTPSPKDCGKQITKMLLLLLLTAMKVMARIVVTIIIVCI